MGSFASASTKKLSAFMHCPIALTLLNFFPDTSLFCVWSPENPTISALPSCDVPPCMGLASSTLAVPVTSVTKTKKKKPSPFLTYSHALL